MKLLVTQSYLLWPCGPARFLCPWNYPGKNTGVHCHSLLQGIFLTQGSNPGLHWRQILYCLSHQENLRVVLSIRLMLATFHNVFSNHLGHHILNYASKITFLYFLNMWPVSNFSYLSMNLKRSFWNSFFTINSYGVH